jgi:hypothetical protein
MTATLNDWDWFNEHPERCFRSRIATAYELDGARECGIALDDKTMNPDHFLHAICRIDREAMKMRILLVAIAPGPELDEEHCQHLFRDGEHIIAGRMQGRPQ